MLSYNHSKGKASETHLVERNKKNKKHYKKDLTLALKCDIL